MQLPECAPGTEVTVVNGPIRFNGVIEGLTLNGQLVMVDLNGGYMTVSAEYLQPGLTGRQYDGPVLDDYADAPQTLEYFESLQKYIAGIVREHRAAVSSMSTKSKISLLVSWCRASVMIEYNNHRDNYETVEEHFNDDGHREQIPNDVFAEMVKTDTVIRLQFYPDTPGGFYVVFHHDLTLAVDAALSIMFDEREKLVKWE